MVGWFGFLLRWELVLVNDGNIGLFFIKVGVVEIVLGLGFIMFMGWLVMFGVKVVGICWVLF